MFTKVRRSIGFLLYNRASTVKAVLPFTSDDVARNAMSARLCRRGAARRRRHEFGADGIADRCLENAIDLRLGGCVKLPPTYLADRLQLAGVASTPQRGGDALIEHPADRQMDHVLAEALSG